MKFRARVWIWFEFFKLKIEKGKCKRKRKWEWSPLGWNESVSAHLPSFPIARSPPFLLGCSAHFYFFSLRTRDTLFSLAHGLQCQRVLSLHRGRADVATTSRKWRRWPWSGASVLNRARPHGWEYKRSRSSLEPFKQNRSHLYNRIIAIVPPPPR
jgi:hypothetical protein